MSGAERYVVEVGGEIAGILVGVDGSFTFFASAQWAWPLNERRFASPGEAELQLIGLRRAS